MALPRSPISSLARGGATRPTGARNRPSSAPAISGGGQFSRPTSPTRPQRFSPSPPRQRAGTNPTSPQRGGRIGGGNPLFGLGGGGAAIGGHVPPSPSSPFNPGNVVPQQPSGSGGGPAIGGNVPPSPATGGGGGAAIGGHVPPSPSNPMHQGNIVPQQPGNPFILPSPPPRTIPYFDRSQFTSTDPGAPPIQATPPLPSPSQPPAGAGLTAPPTNAGGNRIAPPPPGGFASPPPNVPFLNGPPPAVGNPPPLSIPQGPAVLPRGMAPTFGGGAFNNPGVQARLAALFGLGR